MHNDQRRQPIRFLRRANYGSIGMTLVLCGCGGKGELPLAASSANAPPVVVRVEVGGAGQVALGATAPVAAEVRDADGDTVSCRWSAQGGRVLVESSNTCQGVYYAPTSGQSERLDVVPTDAKGAVGGTGSLAFPLMEPTAGPNPNPTPNPGPTPRPTPEPAPQSTPAPAPPPTPAPTPTDAPTPAPQPNRAPTVTVTAMSGSCHPRPGAPCSIPIQAQASDPDGDAIAYTWQGCAAGTAATAACSVSSISSFTATVTVRDPKGASATASATVQGTNSAPTVTIHGGGSCHPNCSIDFSAGGSDADGDPLSYSWSGCTSGTDNRAGCSVTGVGGFTAKVTVNDGWATADQSGSATGTNGRPFCWSADQPAGDWVGYGWDDPDGDPVDNCSATCDGCTAKCRTNKRVDITNGTPGDRISITACDRFNACATCSTTLQ